MDCSFLCALNLLGDGLLLPTGPCEIEIVTLAYKGFVLTVKKQIDVIFENCD